MPKHPPVSAAQMKAALAAADAETPRCSCHDVAMYWAKDGNRRAGGLWLCRPKMQAKSREGMRKLRARRKSEAAS